MLRLPGKREWRAPRRCPGADPAGAGALGAVAQRDRRPRRRLPEGSAALATRQRPQRFRFTQRASFCRRSILGPPRHLTGPPGARVLPGRRPRGLRPPERRSRPAAACPSPRRPPLGNPNCSLGIEQQLPEMSPSPRTGKESPALSNYLPAATGALYSSRGSKSRRAPRGRTVTGGLRSPRNAALERGPEGAPAPLVLRWSQRPADWGPRMRSQRPAAAGARCCRTRSWFCRARALSAHGVQSPLH